VWQGAGASGLGAHSCLVYTLKPSPLPGEMANSDPTSGVVSDLEFNGLLALLHVAHALRLQLCAQTQKRTATLFAVSRLVVIGRCCGCQVS